MDIENVIALAAILTTGAVAFTGQLFSHWREAATRQHTERLQTDAEARSVLDGALATAYEARAALGDYATVLLARLYKSTPATPLFDEIERQVQNQQVIANTALGKLRLDASRLIVRFGQETLYASYASFLLA